MVSHACSVAARWFGADAVAATVDLANPRGKMSTMRGHNEGSLYRRTVTRADGTVWRPWIAAVTINGRQRTKYGRTKEEQKANLKALLADRDLGLAGDDSDLASFLLRWLSETRSGIRPSTYRDYELHCRHLSAGLGRVKLKALTVAMVNDYLRGVLAAGCAPQTAKNRRGVLRNALKYAMSAEMIGRNVAALSQAPRVERKRSGELSAEQVVTLLDATRADRLYPLWLLAILTGQRESELLGLAWPEVDLDGRTVKIEWQLARAADPRPDRRGRTTYHWERVRPKTAGSRHPVALAPIAVEALREWRVRQSAELRALGAEGEHEGLVFTDPKGGPWHVTDLLRAWHATLERVGLPSIRFHDLRHTAATVALSSGYELEDVKQLLGHSTITLTSNTYSHPVPARQREVVAGMEAALERSRTRSRSEPGRAREDPLERLFEHEERCRSGLSERS